MRTIPYKLDVSATPAVEAVSVDDLKSHCRVLTADDDVYLQQIGVAARMQLEADTDCLFGARQCVQAMDRFPALSTPETDHGRLAALELHAFPVNSVTSIQYVDLAGVTQSWSSWQWDNVGGTARIRPVFAAYWPIARYQLNAVTITFNAGYVAVPPLAVHAIKLLVGHWYENRTAYAAGGMGGVESAYRSICNNLKMIWV